MKRIILFTIVTVSAKSYNYSIIDYSKVKSSFVQNLNSINIFIDIVKLVFEQYFFSLPTR